MEQRKYENTLKSIIPSLRYDKPRPKGWGFLFEEELKWRPFIDFVWKKGV